MVVTLDVSKLASDWSNEYACSNMLSMVVTLDVSQWSSSLKLMRSAELQHIPWLTQDVPLGYA